MQGICAVGTSRQSVQDLYRRLWDTYGPQGWWPVYFFEGSPGYHINKYPFPLSAAGRFEVCLGALLTQNTTWINAKHALVHLFEEGLLSAEKLCNISHEDLATIIYCCGYYRQKAKKVQMFSQWWQKSDTEQVPSRAQLLALWGIGQETADSILSYAYHQSIFVADTYAKRLFFQEGLLPHAKASYQQVQTIGSQIQPLAGQDQILAYQEFHALIAEHMKTIGKKISRSSL